VPAAAALEVWEKILAHGQEAGVRAAGLGSRDTLRLEAGMPLYGHELTEDINPVQAGLGFAVKLEGRNFIGHDAIASAKADKTLPVRVGLELEGRRVPREHYAVIASDRSIGEITSGTFSPTLQKPLAMAYVRPEFAAVGTRVGVDIRGTLESALVVKLPFYSRGA
jgi:aminomethyltransferase